MAEILKFLKNKLLSDALSKENRHPLESIQGTGMLMLTEFFFQSLQIFAVNPFFRISAIQTYIARNFHIGEDCYSDGNVISCAVSFCLSFDPDDIRLSAFGADS